VREEESEAKVKTGRLREQCSFVDEGQELTDVSSALLLVYRRTVFIPVRGIYIQHQLVTWGRGQPTGRFSEHSAKNDMVSCDSAWAARRAPLFVDPSTMLSKFH